MKTSLFLTNVIAASLAFVASSASAQSQDIEAQVRQGQQAFGLQLFKRAVQAEPMKNTFMSPVSASMALDMLNNGAAGDTRDAMLKGMGLEGLDLQAINLSNQKLILDLRKKADDFNANRNQWTKGDPLSMSIANAIWARDGVEVKAPFAQQMKALYDAEISTLDFDQSSAADTINAWAAKKTNDKIKKIVEAQVLQKMEMLLANATYFKASWMRPFDVRATRAEDFHMQDGSKREVQFMSQTARMAQLENADYQAFRMDYVGDAAHMLVFVPKGSQDLATFVETIASLPATYRGFDKEASHQRVALRMPKFKFEWERKLNQDLTDLGMGILFTGAADFSLLSPTRLQVSYVKQQTFVALDETGTEAAAVTSVGMERTSVDPSLLVKINVDRPFVFAIRENESGSLLFLGAVQNPTW